MIRESLRRQCEAVVKALYVFENISRRTLRVLRIRITARAASQRAVDKELKTHHAQQRIARAAV